MCRGGRCGEAGRKARTGDGGEREGREGAPSLKSFSTRFGVPTATPTCVFDMYSTCSASLKCCRREKEGAGEGSVPKKRTREKYRGKWSERSGRGEGEEQGRERGRTLANSFPTSINPSFVFVLNPFISLQTRHSRQHICVGESGRRRERTCTSRRHEEQRPRRRLYEASRSLWAFWRGCCRGRGELAGREQVSMKGEKGREEGRAGRTLLHELKQRFPRLDGRSIVNHRLCSTKFISTPLSLGLQKENTHP